MAWAQFMNMMNNVLADYLDDFIVVFLDDILIYLKTIEDYVVHLWKVLQKLQKHLLLVQKHQNARLPMRASSSCGQQVTPAGMRPTESEDQSCAGMGYAPRCKGR